MVKEDGSEERKTRREREEERLRKEILSAAARLFARQSFQKTSMQQIADDVGISVGRIYRFFDGKEEIFRHLVKNVMAHIDRVADEEFQKSDSPMRGLRSAFRQIYLNLEAEHRDLLVILHSENPLRMKHTLVGYLIRQRRGLAEVLEQAMDRGEIRRENPYILATMILSAGAAVLSSSMNEPEMQFDQKEYYETFERVMFDPLVIGGGAAAGKDIGREAAADTKENR